jgi:hypothetical protein
VSNIANAPEGGLESEPELVVIVDWLELEEKTLVVEMNENVVLDSDDPGAYIPVSTSASPRSAAITMIATLRLFI